MRLPVATPPADAIAVTLVKPSPDPTPGPAAESTTELDAQAAAAPAPPPSAAQAMAAPAPTRSPTAIPSFRTAREPRAAAKAKRPPPAAPPAQAPAAAEPVVYAVYEVVVGADGLAESIVLAQSSGTSRYDEAGESMIRSTMTFEQPPASAPRSVTSVIVRFFPEQR